MANEWEGEGDWWEGARSKRGRESQVTNRLAND